MSGVLGYSKGLKVLSIVILIVASEILAAQGSGTLLRLQQSRASLNIESNARHAQGMYGITYGNPGNVWSYPNTASCLLVYSDGKYILEKRDEQTLGKPKTKTAEGTLSPEDLQGLKTILDSEDLKKITNPKVPELPEDTQALREAESIDVQIDRTGTTQRFTTIKERVKTGAITSQFTTSAPSSGLDVFLDSGTPYKKAMSPLMKWFEGVQKKSKSALKESQPQYCAPMNIG
jgi:hypothetical protein